MGVEIIAHGKITPLCHKSCPARGMGVEIYDEDENNEVLWSCPARGMGVEIFWRTISTGSGSRHAPRGAWE